MRGRVKTLHYRALCPVGPGFPQTRAPTGPGPGTLMPRQIPCYSDPMAKNRWYHFSPGGEVADLDGFEKVLELRKAGGFSWCAFVAPGKDDLEPLVEALGLHPLSVEDCFDDDHLPKIDIFPGYTGKCLSWAGDHRRR